MRKVKLATIQPEYIKIPDRYHCLSSEYQNNPDEILQNYIKEQINVTISLIEKAGQMGCDIVVTCEDIAGIGSFIADMTEKNIFPLLAALSSALIETRLSELSAHYAMYIIGCYFKKVGDEIYNAAVIFDRQGTICGQYFKTHLPPDEKWQVSEGRLLDAFELDFGKIGINICYDMMFQECAQVLALKGAEIIFHPTVGYGWYDEIGEATLKTRANDNSLYLVTSKNYVFNHAGKSSIIDYWGQVLVNAGFYQNVIVTQEIDLDVRKVQPEWYNPVVMSQVADVRKRHFMERRPDLYDAICTPQTDKFIVPETALQFSILEKMKTGKCHW